MSVPASRIRVLNDVPLRSDGGYVLYWMTSARRRAYNFGLQRAAELAKAHRCGLVVFEPLRVGYEWASDRLHGFVLDGMAANRRAFDHGHVVYYPYVEPEAGAGKGLLAALSERAVVVVTDYLPSFFLSRMLKAASKKLAARLEVVDSNGLLPIAAAQNDFYSAYLFRRFLQKHLAQNLSELPDEDPLAHARFAQVSIAEVTKRWPMASGALLARDAEAIAALPIDHTVGVVSMRGGAEVAAQRLDDFLDEKLARYGEDRNQPDDDAASGLSPYLHFGHLAVHHVFARLAEHEGWTSAKLTRITSGKREGWWGMSPAAESFLDELVTWRELGYNHCARNPTTYDRYESLPDWARKTLATHASDPRPNEYSLDELASASTHDEVWNAAQRELVREGRMHNYLRMLWGKKILEWSPTPKVALERLIELNNRYALDGRNPNSYSGIFWTLGRYDRPWAPERAIFGQIRYMSSANTLKKLHMKKYLARFA
ncbi:MAG: deoxyribodipyrimidine photolyase [Polyangia bacterium]